MKRESHLDGNVVVQRAIDVLEAVAAARGRPRSLADLVEQLQLPKATVHRLLTTLVERGYVSRAMDEGHGYRLGIRCYELGSLTHRYGVLRDAAAEEMASLNRESGELVVLAVYDHGDAVYVDTRKGTHPVACESDPGFRAPATCVSTGRALLAFQPEAEIARVLAAVIPQYSSHTIVAASAIRELLAGVRESGIAVNRESYREGVGGVSSVIRDPTGAAIASVGFCMPVYRMNESRFPWLRDAVATAAERISHALGFSGEALDADQHRGATAGTAGAAVATVSEPCVSSAGGR